MEIPSCDLERGFRGCQQEILVHRHTVATEEDFHV